MRQETASELTDDCDCSVQYLAKMIAYSVSQTASHSCSALYVAKWFLPPRRATSLFPDFCRPSVLQPKNGSK